MSSKKKVVSTFRIVDPAKKGMKRPVNVTQEYIGTAEAQWTCSSCGTKENPGFSKFCPHCGNPRDSSETYHAPGDSIVKFKTNEELIEGGIDHEHSSDQRCNYCGYYSKPGTNICPYCGAHLADVARTYRKCPNCDVETNHVVCPQCGETTKLKTATGGRAPGFFSSVSFLNDKKNISKFISGVWWIPFLSLFVIILVAFWPRQPKASVEDAWWVYTVFLEEYKYNHHEGWKPDGDLVGQKQRIHHYETIVDGYHTECHDSYEVVGYDNVTDTQETCESVYSHTDVTCYDDGSCDYDDVYQTECHSEQVSHQEPVYGYVERCQEVADTHQEPVYSTWYSYSVWEWVEIPPVTTSQHDFLPMWPTNYELSDRRRVAGKKEEYYVLLKSVRANESYVYTPANLAEYEKFQPGTLWHVEIMDGELINVSPLDNGE